MIWADYVIIGIIILSALIGLLRGFVREVLTLIAWIAAIWVAISFAQPLAGLLIQQISAPSLRLIAAFSALFLGTLLVAAVINHLIVRIVDKAALGGADNILGVLFGIARGVALVVLLVLLAGATPLPKDPWWKQSVLIDRFEEMALRLRAYLPPDLAQHFAFANEKDLGVKGSNRL